MISLSCLSSIEGPISMATQTPTPVKEPTNSLSENALKTPEPTPSTALSPAVKSETPVKVSAPITSRQPENSPSETNSITIPSYSRWFSWEKIHQCERRFLPEFFDGKSSSKNPKIYKYYRDSIIRIFRRNPSRKITFTQVRKVIVGDVGSIRRVFDFLESWGLINYSGAAPKPNSKYEDKENKEKGSPRKFCSGCKCVCSMACFVSNKFDLTLCGRCFVRSNGRNEISAGDFRRVEISEETKTGWTDKETLHLLEAITHYGDDWKKVAMHVGGRSEKECVAHFLKLPFGEQFVGHPDSEEVDKYSQTKNHGDAETEEEDAFLSSLAKRRRLTPFADASNPIVAQAAFLSAMVGSEVAEAAAQAAVAALSKVDLAIDRRRKYNDIPLDETQQKESANNDTAMGTLEEAVAESYALINREEEDLERSISNIIEVQMKEIQDKIVKFEEVESQMEREWKQLHQMKNLLFADQLNLLFQRAKSPVKIGESTEGVVLTTDAAVVA